MISGRLTARPPKTRFNALAPGHLIKNMEKRLFKSGKTPSIRLFWAVLLLALAAGRPALCQVDFQKDFANLRDREYYIRIGLEDCDSDRSVVRVVCDREFELLDREGKVLFKSPGEIPLRFSRHDAQPATNVYYYILETFDSSERASAEQYANTAQD